MTIPETQKDKKGIQLKSPNPNLTQDQWEKNIQNYRDTPKNKGLDFIEEDGKIKAIKKHKFTNIMDAVRDLGVNWEGKLEKTNQNNFIKDTGVVSSGKARFEELSS